MSILQSTTSAWVAVAMFGISIATGPAATAESPEAAAITAGLFEAMEAGQVDAKIVPRNAMEATVLIRNLTDKPLALRMPPAFASLPVLAQGFGGGMGGGGMGGGGMGGGGQAGGGGMGGMGGGGMGGMGGGGAFRVAPEQLRKLKVNTVCLEHGKPDPHPKMEYRIAPLEEFTDDGRIHALCEALGRGLVSQNVAQAVAWHVMDGMSWETLAAKNREESKYTGNLPWFSPQELTLAMAVAAEVERIQQSRDSSSSSELASSQAATSEPPASLSRYQP